MIDLFWWSERRLAGSESENYGDLLGKYIVERLSGRPVRFRHPGKFSLMRMFNPTYLGVGSILHFANRRCIVWGSGIIDRKSRVKPADFLAVRGPESGRRLRELGYRDPGVYGDPAILLPTLYAPEVERAAPLGFVPHHVDHAEVVAGTSHLEGTIVVDLRTNDVEGTTRDILSCRRILSSSLHGLIVAHSYGIPAVWQRYSGRLFGDDIKFRDYFLSVGIEPYVPPISSPPTCLAEVDDLFDSHPSLPAANVLDGLRRDLVRTCPFQRSRDSAARARMQAGSDAR
jgi:hypothetical protein